MLNKIPSILVSFKNFFQSKIVIGVIIAIVASVGIYFIFFKHNPVYQFVTVQRGPITESVSLTGNTAPMQSVSLTFGSGGTISHVYSDLGKKINAGQLLAELNTNDIVAQLHQTQAAYSVAQTTYEKLVNGASTPDIEVARVALNNAKNAYNDTVAQQKVLVTNALSAMYNSGLTAIPLTNSTSIIASPTISGTYTGTEQGTYTVMVYGNYFSYSGLENGSDTIGTVPAALGTHGLYIQFPSNFSSGVNNTWTVAIPNTQSSTYLTYNNAYQAALQNQTQAITTAQGIVDVAQAALDQKKAGPRSEDLAITKAQVDQAQASIESVNAKLQNARIVAPISGTITQFDVKIGQLASPSVPLISIMSGGGYEVDAGVSEIDVGKISVGDKTSMTLDAFPGETFTGSVFYIAPAQTNIQGVITYQTKIAFSKINPRFKSGLTVNVNIETNHKENIFILPQYAILQNDLGTFVETLENNKIKQNPVTLGIQDQKGNVEIVSGVTEMEQVLNIGLKVQ